MLKVSTLSFPGLGIGEFTVNSVAVTVFGRQIAWYGLIITLGMILACVYVAYRAKEAGISIDTVMDYAIFTIVFGVIGARLYYVIMEHDQYNSFWDVIAVWNGGLAIYGGIIAGIITIVVVSKVKKISYRLFMDFSAPAVMIGQLIGRWGNFMNGEAYGSETMLPWRMGIKKYTEMVYVHPTFLYESLWNLLGFILINLFYKHKKYDGQIVLMYLAWYGFGRMLIEGLRTDSLYIFGPVRVSQLVGFLCFIGGTAMLVYMFIRGRINKSAKTKGEK